MPPFVEIIKLRFFFITLISARKSIYLSIHDVAYNMKLFKMLVFSYSNCSITLKLLTLNRDRNHKSQNKFYLFSKMYK